MKTGHIKSKMFRAAPYRIDPSFHLSEGIKVRRMLDNVPYGLTTVGDASDKVFIGNIFSRVFVKDAAHGVPYLAASDSMLADLNTRRFLSKSQSIELQYLKIKKNWILTTCSGTIGKIAYTNKDFEGRIATHDLVRIIPSDNNVLRGCLYAFLSSKYGYYQITESKFGGVVKHVNAEHIKGIQVPVFPADIQKTVDALVKDAALLRERCAELKAESIKYFEEKSGLGPICEAEYESYGPRSQNKQVSCFSKNIAEVGHVTINAFNHSNRITLLKNRLSQTTRTISLKDCLTEKGLFSTGAFPRVELESDRGVELINQRDIFDSIIKGKMISKRGVSLDKLVEKDEIIIAGVGTLGESETFCRCVYGNDYLKGKLISGEFIRMKTNSSIPAGYLFMWLSSDYGFRLIRSTQAGTKLCRPIPQLLENIPVPILDRNDMSIIDAYVKESQDCFAKASFKEQEAINMIEVEIEKWNN